MDNKENPMQPEPEISEEEMDLLLEKFLAEDHEEPFPADAADDDFAENEEPAAEENAEETVAEIPEEIAENVEEDTTAPEDSNEESSPEQEPSTEDEPEEETEAESQPDLIADVSDDAEAEVAAGASENEEPEPLTEEALWENQPVDAPALLDEIGPDIFVEVSTGLTNPADLEFEQIMEETLQEAAAEEALRAQEEADPTEEETEDEENFDLSDEYFLPAEDGSQDPQAQEKEPVYTELDLTDEQKKALEMAQSDLEEASHQTEEALPAEEESIQEAPPKKRRPKNTRAYGFFDIPHMLVTAIWLALILFIGAGIGTMVWEVAADMLAFGRPNQTVTITITAKDDLDSIAQKLHDTGLIKYPGIFKFYGNLSNAEKKIKPGTYALNTIYDYMALVKNMAGTADRVSTKVVIPEGYTCAQIFRLLEKNGICTVESMEEAVLNADLSKYWFLEGVDQSNPNCLEGYLFPDTYEFYLDHDPNGVLTRLLDTFGKRFSDTMIEKLDILNENLADMMRSHGLSESYIQDNLFTMRELVIVASMIEKETSGDDESYYIASVIYNRLTNPGEYPYLNIDAALVYITGRSPITAEDLKLDTPYNTYLYQGLIPGPISNPGLASLNAALSPEITEYYFYALDPSVGEHKFFNTYKEHQAFLESLRKGD